LERSIRKETGENNSNIEEEEEGKIEDKDEQKKRTGPQTTGKNAPGHRVSEEDKGQRLRERPEEIPEMKGKGSQEIKASN
jgi:hypothetical protein